MTGAHRILHIFMLASQGSNWKSIFMHSSPALRGPCSLLGLTEHRRNVACLSPPALFKGWAPLCRSHPAHIPGRKKKFICSLPKCVHAAPSARAVFGAHQATLIPIQQGFKLPWLLAPGSMVLELSMVSAPVLMVSLIANI